MNIDLVGLSSKGGMAALLEGQEVRVSKSELRVSEENSQKQSQKDSNKFKAVRGKNLSLDGCQLSMTETEHKSFSN